MPVAEKATNPSTSAARDRERERMSTETRSATEHGSAADLIRAVMERAEIDPDAETREELEQWYDCDRMRAHVAAHKAAVAKAQAVEAYAKGIDASERRDAAHLAWAVNDVTRATDTACAAAGFAVDYAPHLSLAEAAGVTDALAAAAACLIYEEATEQLET